ncbi:MAG TPA: cyclase family protein [Clostridiaceae bacterium]|nr:cyclase family protein [Clostridiaceae bacterium]
MKYYDITLDFFEGMITFEGDPKPEVKQVSSIDEGAMYNLSLISFGSHTGTHIDAPLHFCKNGKAIDELDFDYFLGKAKVIEIFDPVSVKKDELMKHHIKRGDILLLKTENSRRRLLSRGKFVTDYCYLEPEAAEYLAQVGIKTLGYDFLSPEKYNFSTPGAHLALLKNNIVIAEGLLLEDVPEGEYEIIMLPMKIKGGNGSPVRAVLIER